MAWYSVQMVCFVGMVNMNEVDCNWELLKKSDYVLKSVV